MSLIPEVPVDLLEELFGKYDISVSVTERGVLLRRADTPYRMAVTDDGFVRGSAIQRACLVFGVDVFDFIQLDESR